MKTVTKKTLLECAEDLSKAAELIRIHGHAKHVLQNTNGAMCLRGALRMAIIREPFLLRESAGDEFLRQRRAEAFVSDVVDPAKCYKEWPEDNIIWWNNAIERTQDEVVLALEEAASAALTEAMR